MSTATEMLALAQAAYQEALAGKETTYNGRRWTTHDINLLSAEVEKWQRAVNAEARLAAGGSRTSFSQATFAD